VLTLRQVVEITAGALARPLEIVSMPYSLAVCARPLVMQSLSTHRVFDLTKLRTQLGYRDRVPAREALARTALWLEHIARGGGRGASCRIP
jgi:nucleoside-diphosphate-sugar epimerase